MPIPISADQSTDSTFLEDAIDERTITDKHRKDSKNVRDRYRIIRQQFVNTFHLCIFFLHFLRKIAFNSVIPFICLYTCFSQLRNQFGRNLEGWFLSFWESSLFWFVYVVWKYHFLLVLDNYSEYERFFRCGTEYFSMP